MTTLSTGVTVHVYTENQIEIPVDERADQAFLQLLGAMGFRYAAR